MYITECAICDQPITSETESLQSKIGLVCANKCFDKTDTELCIICGEPIIKETIGKDNIKFCSHKCADYHNMNYPSDAFTALAFGKPIFE